MKLTRCLMVGLYGIENSGVRHLTSMLKQRGGYRADLMFFKDWRHNRVEWPVGCGHRAESWWPQAPTVNRPGRSGAGRFASISTTFPSSSSS